MFPSSFDDFLPVVEVTSIEGLRSMVVYRFFADPNAEAMSPKYGATFPKERAVTKKKNNNNKFDWIL